jgi:hypothetical protein
MQKFWLSLLTVVLAIGVVGCQEKADSHDNGVENAVRGQPRRSDDSDHEAIDELSRRARQNFVEERCTQLEALVWKDRFILCSFETGQPEIATFDTAMQVMQNSVEAFDEILPHPASTQFDLRGPVAVVRLPMASCRKGERTSLVEYLAIVARQNSEWKIAAAVLGNWKLTEADSFDPQNEDHQKLQTFYDQAEQALVNEDIDVLRDGDHTLFRLIWPGPETDMMEDASIGDREGLLSHFQDLWKQSDFQKHHHEIIFAKVIGPLALTLAECSEIVDGGPEKTWKCLQFFCRDGDQWKACIWMPGDWQKTFMAE